MIGKELPQLSEGDIINTKGIFIQKQFVYGSEKISFVAGWCQKQKQKAIKCYNKASCEEFKCCMFSRLHAKATAFSLLCVLKAYILVQSISRNV